MKTFKDLTEHQVNKISGILYPAHIRDNDKVEKVVKYAALKTRIKILINDIKHTVEDNEEYAYNTNCGFNPYDLPIRERLHVIIDKNLKFTAYKEYRYSGGKIEKFQVEPTPICEDKAKAYLKKIMKYN